MSFSDTQPPCYGTGPVPPPPAPGQGFSSKFGGCLVGCACGCLFSLLFPFLLVVLSAFSCTRLLNDSPQTLLSDCTSAPQEILREGAGKRAIAVIPVQGVIGFHSGGNSFLDSPRPGDANRIVQALQQVADSPERYGAVILDMNTPGGEVVASDAVRRQLDRLPQEIPVVTCIRSLGASGGYYIASGSDWIVANPMSLTGSVGVIIRSMEYGPLLEKLGVRPVVYRSGEFKDILGGYRQATPQEQAYMQAMVDTDFRHFCAVVSQGRPKAFPTPESVAESPAGDGRPLLGEAALELGMVDQLGDFEDAVAKARELGDCPDAPLVRLGTRSPFSALFSSLPAPAQGSLSVSLPGMPAPQGPLPLGTRFYLLPQDAAAPSAP